MFDLITSKWNKRTDGLYPSASLKNIELEQRSEKKLNDVNSFNNSINNIKEMVAYFKDKNNKSRKEILKKTLPTIRKSFDKIVIIAT